LGIYLEILNKDLKNFKDEAEKLDCNFKFKPLCKKGTPYFPIIAKSLEKEEEKVFIQNDGVTVVDFWAQWCGPCVQGMNHNLEMIEKNFEKWNGKVKFFTLTICDQEDKINTTEFIEKKKWNRF